MAPLKLAACLFLTLLTLSCTTPGSCVANCGATTGASATTPTRPRPGSVPNGGACEANADCAGRLVCLFGMCQP